MSRAGNKVARTRRFPYNSQLLDLAYTFSQKGIAYRDGPHNSIITATWCDEALIHGRRQLLGMTATLSAGDDKVRIARFFSAEGRDSASSVTALEELKTFNNCPDPTDTHSAPIAEAFEAYLEIYGPSDMAICCYGISKALAERFASVEFRVPIKEEG